MFSPIQLTPDMDSQTLVNAVNSNFRQVEEENRSKLIVDSEGVPRVRIGLVRGEEENYGIYISVKGVNVDEVLEGKNG